MLKNQYLKIIKLLSEFPLFSSKFVHGDINNNLLGIYLLLSLNNFVVYKAKFPPALSPAIITEKIVY